MNVNNHRLRTWTEQRMIPIPQLFFQFYKELNMEDEEALIVMHLLAFHMEENDFPTPNDLKNRLTMSDNDITSRLQRLMQKGFLEITRDVDAGGKLYEKYSVYAMGAHFADDRYERAATNGSDTSTRRRGDIPSF